MVEIELASLSKPQLALDLSQDLALPLETKLRREVFDNLRHVKRKLEMIFGIKIPFLRILQR